MDTEVIIFIKDKYAGHDNGQSKIIDMGVLALLYRYRSLMQGCDDYIVIIDKLFKLNFNNFNNIHHHPSSLARIIRTNASFEHLFLLHCSGSSFAVVSYPLAFRTIGPFL